MSITFDAETEIKIKDLVSTFACEPSDLVRIESLIRVSLGYERKCYNAGLRTGPEEQVLSVLGII